MTINPELDAVLEETWPVLLDFDGPITHLFINGRNRMVADRMRTALPAGVDLPEDLRDTHDPLIILRWVGRTLDQPTLARVEGACVEGEKIAAAASSPTPGATELLTACAQSKRPIIVVSNNAEEPIRQFLRAHKLDHLVAGVVGRVPGSPELMKPEPSSVLSAVDRLATDPRRCAMIGDSVSDIQVCKTTGVRSIGFAKNPRRGEQLRSAGADAVVDNLLQIAEHPRLPASKSSASHLGRN